MKRWTIRISPRRAALRGLVLLILGVVTTVGVAWGLALICTISLGAPPHATGYSQDGTYFNEWAVEIRSFIFVRRYDSHWTSADANDVFLEGAARDYADRPAESLVPFWAGVLEPYEDVDRQAPRQYWAHARSFCGAMCYGYRLDPESDEMILRGGFLYPGDDQPTFLEAAAGMPRVLPLRPIFPGFIINTLFYAAIWFGVFFGVAALRRAMRRRRGRCAKCGYDLRGALDSGCPECGWNRSDT